MLHLLKTFIKGKIETTDNETAAVIGLTQRSIRCTPIEQLKEDSDFEHRIPKTQWWLKLRPLLRILTKHESVYIPEIQSDSSQ
ncbi:hypothetical protein GJ496_003000 [Pomphorhynchus laevis]|nr:hypothetical protein GJ496_003000 [Pomphorhynchus laevis]